MMKDWFLTYFDNDYWDLVGSYGLLDREISFLESLLVQDSNVLDLCCGIGRILIPLAIKGYQITGIDISSKSISYVRERMQNHSAQVFCQDVRKLSNKNEFDNILLMQSSFGYFSEQENQQLLGKIYQALKIGGKLILDVANRDGMIRNFREKEWVQIGRKVYLIHHQFDLICSRRNTRLIVLEGDEKREYYHSIRLYSIQELINLMKQVGFHIDHVNGDFTTEQPSFQTRRVQLVAYK